jgi:hypothetical protein
MNERLCRANSEEGLAFQKLNGLTVAKEKQKYHMISSFLSALTLASDKSAAYPGPNQFEKFSLRIARIIHMNNRSPEFADHFSPSRGRDTRL